jgi:hypothetical protein
MWEGYEEMLQNNTWTFSQLRAKGGQPGAQDALFRMAAARYRKARLRAWMGRLRALLLGRDHRLLHLGSLGAGSSLRGGRYAGLRSVPISRIQGSEGRSDDFDAEFRPLKAHNRWRWVSLAAARLRGAALPPVELIQVGEIYFVRDGHHRISVAKAFGQEQIDAEVTVWDLTGPLPWAEQVPAGQMACRAA